MKKTTFFNRLSVIVGLFLITAGTVFAGNIKTSNNGTSKFIVSENTYSLIKVTNTLTDIGFMDIKTKEGNFTMFNVADYGYTIEPGNPKLPVIKKLIEVPLNATFETHILYADYSEFNLSDFGINTFIFPAQPPLSKSIDNPDDVAFIYNKDAYKVNSFAGQELVKIVDLGIMRGVRMARIEIAPVLYNAVTNSIKVYTNVEVKINFKNADIQSTINNKKKYFSPYCEGIYSELVNFKPVNGKELIMDEPVTYVIVSDPMFQDALQPFIQWKVKKGFNVIEGYTNDPAVGTTTTSIKNYLAGLYNNPAPGVNPQSFVLLVGDVAQIPAFSGTTGSHVSDLYYCCYDGAGDIYPECYYGRFSANNLTQLQPQIDKTLEYEQYLFPDPSFLDEVVMSAGADAAHQLTWGNGQINYGTNNYFNAAHGLLSHTYLQPEPTGGNYSQNIHNDVSNGVSYANYTAHCSEMGWYDPSFVIGDIAALTNAHKYPLMVGNCCLAVAFQTNCFGEEILRAANKGALGYIGGSNSTYWDEDFWWGVGFKTVSANPTYSADHLGAYDRTFHDHGEPLNEWYVTQGQMPQAGDLAVTQSGSSLETYYWEIYHLMGDPSLSIYFSQPPETMANYAALMPLASSSFTVNTEPYAYVAISKDGVLNGCTVADENGLAEVNMFNPIVVPGEADVVITGQNIKPYMGTVTVASPTGPYVLFDEMTVNDNSGNGNGMIDFGETILLNISLENLGSQPASNVVATLSTTDEFVTINNSSHNWPEIAAGGSISETGAFSFTVNNIVPDQHTVQFDIEITDGNETWNSTINVVLNSPALEIGVCSIDDSDGNNNGRLDPGETVNLIVPTDNAGGCEAVDVIASAISGSPEITLNNIIYNLQTIATGESHDAIFNISVSPDAQTGDMAYIGYCVTSGPYSANNMFSLPVGLVVEDYESSGFNHLAWGFCGNANWIISNSGIRR